MEINAGKRNLEQSRHHPQYQKASHNENIPNMPAESPPNKQQENSNIYMQIHRIITSLDIQNPTKQLPKIFLNFIIAIRNNAIALQKQQYNHKATTKNNNNAPITK